MNDKFKWVMSMLTLPGILLLMVTISQWEFNSSGYVRFRSSAFEGEEALFILAVLKIFFTVISVHAAIAIYRRYTDLEFDKRYLDNLQKNEAHICLDCKEAFILEGRNKCNYCGSSAIEPVKGIFERYPNIEDSQDLTSIDQKHKYHKKKPISKEERNFNFFLIVWSVLWLSGLFYKFTINNDFIEIIIFAWPFFIIAYLVPYIIKIIKIK